MYERRNSWNVKDARHGNYAEWYAMYSNRRAVAMDMAGNVLLYYVFPRLKERHNNVLRTCFGIYPEVVDMIPCLHHI